MGRKAHSAQAHLRLHYHHSPDLYANPILPVSNKQCLHRATKLGINGELGQGIYACTHTQSPHTPLILALWRTLLSYVTHALSEWVLPDRSVKVLSIDQMKLTSGYTTHVLEFDCCPASGDNVPGW